MDVDIRAVWLESEVPVQEQVRRNSVQAHLWNKAHGIAREIEDALNEDCGYELAVMKRMPK